jgi:hypothetical protein
MLCCRKIVKGICGAVCLFGLIFVFQNVSAEGIEISKVEARLTDEGYILSADFEISLPPPVEEALKRGVTLYFISELSIHRSRWYWVDNEIRSHEQTTKLSFNTLTQQYRISRGGLYQSFFELKDALQVLGHQTAPAIPATLLDNNSGGYISRWAKKGSEIGAYAAMKLDVSQLPKPLQVNALASDQWNVDSIRYHWDISPVSSSNNRGRP